MSSIIEEMHAHDICLFLGKLLKLTGKMLRRLLEFMGTDDYKILHQNQEQIVLLGPDRTERICGCYPGSVTVRPLKDS